MTTKEAVNIALQQIGAEGLGGVKTSAQSVSEALRSLNLEDFGSLTASRVIAELRRQNLAQITRTGNSYHFQLSVKGIHRLQRAQVERIRILRPEHWDGIWRMVTYDVPRAQSAQRRLFTRQLERLGFTMVRESVWFHPHPCFAEVESLIGYCSLQRHVTLAEISRIDNVSLARLKRAYPGL